MSFAHLATVLSDSLDLVQPPVAVSFTDAVPNGVTNYAGRVPAGCKFWEEGVESAFATTASDHGLCAIGVHTHNLKTSPAQQADLMDALKVFADLDYVRPQDIASIPVLGKQPEHVVYAPLAETPLPPDVVILFVNAGQTLILSEAVQQVESQNAPAMGRPACAVVPQVANSGRAALSLGCCGARAYLDNLQDDVAIFAIPGANLEAYVVRIEALAKANGILSQFHQLRREQVAEGGAPSVKESLAAMGS
jgi:uncharacterized protein (DUF169 family)